MSELFLKFINSVHSDSDNDWYDAAGERTVIPIAIGKRRWRSSTGKWCTQWSTYGNNELYGVCKSVHGDRQWRANE
ncbi:MAG: hypothetical protein Q7U47_01185 [Paludibacter sp.]|nr:hypothetical protein [Paludibacter sp.]